MANAKKKPAVEIGEPRLEWVRLSQIKPAKRNPKEHDIPAIVASIKRHAFRAPLIEDAATGRIAAGHGRKEATEVLFAEDPKKVWPGIKVAEDGEWMLPVIRGMAFESERHAEEYLLADNRLVELGGWDDAALAPMLAQLARRGDEAIAAVGWSSDQIDTLLAQVAASSTAPGEFPSVSPGSVTVTYCCPKCKYAWSGSADPAKALEGRESKK